MFGFIVQVEELLIDVHLQALGRLQDFGLKPFGSGDDFLVFDIGVVEVGGQFLNGYFLEHSLHFVKCLHFVLHRRTIRFDYDRISRT